MDPLFPPLPENLKELSDEELSALLTEHEVAADLIDNDDEDFIKGMEADEVLSAYEAGVEQIDAIKAEQQDRVNAQEAYLARKAELAAKRKGEEPVEDEVEETEEETEELAAKAEDEGDESDSNDAESEEEKVEEPETVVAAAAPARLRRPPRPSQDRIIVNEPGAALVAASGLQDTRAGQVLNPLTLAEAMRKEVQRRGRPTKSQYGVEERIAIAAAEFPFPEERSLRSGDPDGNAEKIRAVVPASAPGFFGTPLNPNSDNIVASGGLCAPLTPLYTMPNFATEARPVRDALPSFNAARGGVNVPEATYIADITTAITVIEESEDAQGGTFATKSCQDLDCPDYTETAVTIISHCREYGNLNARAWPEKIAHENALTMAAHARTAETYLLDRIKALSINVTNGADTLGAMIYFVDGVTRAVAGIRYRLRMDANARFRVLLPAWLREVFELDQVQNQFNRYTSLDQMVSYLRTLGITPTWYLDNVTGAVPFNAESAGVIDDFPDTVQWAIFPEGAFLHIDGGTLELGLVRDSTLNSTNDFQIFGESFENVARIAPAQAALWLTSDLCPAGTFPAAGTTRTCA